MVVTEPHHLWNNLAHEYKIVLVDELIDTFWLMNFERNYEKEIVARHASDSRILVQKPEKNCLSIWVCALWS
jgi:hypothetical protein